ncbi:hypothetical protein A3A14_01780 [Candidatus Daviesbacteria bacterium RIFCSPLOWO2_01_FULL_43_38]|uniref:Uncharacterized protein n=3 Tax=Candidatus Daviesiibacteriota TaxID=1752718 RepID=A0A1F5K589_9BACT|nr:MAG: hypothetical protein UV33_C0029G0005 [Candidatus Daviesbacteria bacterium GW2011_GWA1_42_6]KKS69358.1 MAG: hypothetical protein UV41_C0056G0009 [Candidatus Daviesbacteria bacterium GW2011_GWA2_42_7]OGE20168.1 MAG: hypothetical protein A2874_03290 [Candidatus Daviesbacteria bacterium RIFCSPHIGHO2_01_FULL_43_17]OGE36067.1 MAG: hypothetical protein A3E45_04000 [Candidatus Daviesbacteria bacterium RIFCSPHIGHO2_12_FULL_43_11]OGE63971.1 MAG: hypothetical protein A3A14_01780 [Candidatus Davies
MDKDVLHPSITDGEPKPSSDVAKELQEKYPKLYQEFSNRVDRFVGILDDFERTFDEKYYPSTTRIVPLEGRKDVFKKIAGGFKDFIIQTRLPEIRRAEAQKYDSDSARMSRIAIAMGAYRNSALGMGSQADYTPDVVSDLSDELLREVTGPYPTSYYLRELYNAGGEYPPKWGARYTELPEDTRAIKAVGLLLIARLDPSVSAAVHGLAQDELVTAGRVTTIDGGPADTAQRILTSAGAQPYTRTG